MIQELLIWLKNQSFQDRYRFKMLHILSGIGIFFSSYITVINFTRGEYPLAISALFFIAGLLINLIFLWFKPNIRIASHLVLAIYGLYPLFLLSEGYDIYTGKYYWFIAFPVAAVSFLDDRSSLIWIILAYSVLAIGLSVIHFQAHAGQDFGVEMRFILGYAIIILFSYFSIIIRREFENESNQLQQKLYKESHFAALGKVSGGVAHEVNNPLTIISLANDDIIASASAEEMDKENILKKAEVIEKSVIRITGIVNSLKNFAHDVEAEELQKVKISTLMEDVINLCGKRFETHKVELKFEYLGLGDDLVIRIRRMQITDAILNILENAFDVVTQLEERWIKIEISQEGPDIIFAIMNSGDKITMSVSEKIFEPFYSSGARKGLGLSSVKGIIENHQGDLYVDHECCDHTCFKIRIPKNC